MLATVVNNTVDAIQTSKKIFVDTFVKHEGLAKSFHEFVDAQTNYTKQAIDASVKAGTEVYKTVYDKSFYADAMKSAQESAQALFHTQKKEK